MHRKRIDFHKIRDQSDPITFDQDPYDSDTSKASGCLILWITSRFITFPRHMSDLSQPFDLVTCRAWNREKRTIYIDRADGSQVWQITKLMKVLEHPTDSSNCCAAFRHAWPMVSPWVFLPVVLSSAKLKSMMESSTLPETNADGGRGWSGNIRRIQAIPVSDF